MAAALNWAGIQPDVTVQSCAAGWSTDPSSVPSGRSHMGREFKQQAGSCCSQIAFISYVECPQWSQERQMDFLSRKPPFWGRKKKKDQWLGLKSLNYMYELNWKQTNQEIKGYKRLCTVHPVPPIIVPVNTLIFPVIWFLESHDLSSSDTKGS